MAGGCSISREISFDSRSTVRVAFRALAQPPTADTISHRVEHPVGTVRPINVLDTFVKVHASGQVNKPSGEINFAPPSPLCVSLFYFLPTPSLPVPPSLFSVSRLLLPSVGQLANVDEQRLEARVVCTVGDESLEFRWTRFQSYSA